MRRDYNKSSGGILPPGYAECEYLESKGSQWINVGLTTSSDWNTYEFVGEFARSGEPAGAAFGTHYWGMGSSGTTWWDFGGNIELYRTYKLRMFKQIKSYMEAYLDDEFKIRSTSRDWINSYFNTPLHIFRLTNGNIGKWRCYSGNYIINSEIKRNFKPCIRLSDSKPGLYDLCGSICPLTGTPFYVNAGTGEFLYQLKS